MNECHKRGPTITQGNCSLEIPASIVIDITFSPSVNVQYVVLNGGFTTLATPSPRPAKRSQLTVMIHPQTHIRDRIQPIGHTINAPSQQPYSTQKQVNAPHSEENRESTTVRMSRSRNTIGKKLKR
jgi:hypothetical protein